MEKTLFKVVDICQSNKIERKFIQELHQNGLIEIIVEQETEFIEEEQISQIERFSTWHYELEINVHGIEVVQQLIDRIEKLQQEVRILKGR